MREAHGRKPRVLDLVQLVSKFQSTHGLKSGDSLEELAERLGIEVIPYPHRVPEGYSEFIDGRWQVTISTQQSREEREFTLAHELAHAVLGIQDDAEAEQCAAELVWEERYQRVLEALHAIAKDPATCGTDFSSAWCSFHSLQANLADQRKITASRQMMLMIGFGMLAYLSALGIGALIDRFKGARSR